MNKKMLIALFLLGIFIGVSVMWVYHEYKYHLTFSNSICEGIGFKNFAGLFIEDANFIRIVCNSDEGYHVVVREVYEDGVYK